MQTAQPTNSVEAANVAHYGVPQTGREGAAHTLQLFGAQARSIADACAEYMVDGQWCTGAVVSTLPPICNGVPHVLLTVYGITPWCKTSLDVHNVAHTFFCAAQRFANP